MRVRSKITSRCCRRTCKMLIPFPFVAFYIFLVLSSGQAAIEEELVKNEGNYIVCHSCQGPRKDTELKRILDAETAREFFETLATVYKLEVDINVYPIFKNIKTCEICELASVICNQKEDPNHRLCLQRTATFVIKLVNRQIEDEVKTEAFITMLKFEGSSMRNDMREGSLNREKRSLRRFDVCRTPSFLQTASISCAAKEFFVKCFQQCAFGYTLEDSIVRELTCNYTEDIWEPTKFEECSPFVNCRIKLVNGGFANCSSLGVADGPECKIMCQPFEDKDETPEQSYRCQIDGTWDPPLPFCAEPQKGLNLVKAPAIKLHRDTKEWDSK